MIDTHVDQVWGRAGEAKRLAIVQQSASTVDRRREKFEEDARKISRTLVELG